VSVVPFRSRVTLVMTGAAGGTTITTGARPAGVTSLTVGFEVSVNGDGGRECAGLQLNGWDSRWKFAGSVKLECAATVWELHDRIDWAAEVAGLTASVNETCRGNGYPLKECEVEGRLPCRPVRCPGPVIPTECSASVTGKGEPEMWSNLRRLQ